MLDDLLKSIDAKLERIKSHPEFSREYFRVVSHSLHEESFRHSWNLEECCSDDGVQILTKAWNSLKEQGISLGSISTLGHLVEPDTKPMFRHQDVAFGGFYPIESSKVIYKMKDFVDFYNEKDEFHPLLKSVELHNLMVQIHPFEDGNGRAARLISNMFLVDNGYLPYTIRSDKREEYISLLKQVMKDRFNDRSSIYDPSIAGIKFYEYVAEKIMNSVDFAESELNKRRMYKVTLTKSREKKLLSRSLANSISSCKQVGSKVSITADHNSLHVVGDVSLEELHDCISWYKGNRASINFKYKLKTIY